jgi:hypothetical protein
LSTNRFLRRADSGVLTASDKQELLDKHNSLRSQVALGNTDGEPMATDMTELIWDDALAASSATYASECKFAHPGGTFGENLYAAASTIDNIDNIAKLVSGVQNWFDEYKFYTYGTIGGTEDCDDGKQCGHYTQVVWANTLSVGCGYSECSKKIFGPAWEYEIILVCRYSPAGNFQTQHPYTKTTSATDVASSCPSGYSKDATSGLCKVTANQSSENPSAKPSKQPSANPSSKPSKQPSANPSPKPVANQSSENPSSKPSKQPSAKPSISANPSAKPSKQPSAKPSVSENPSSKPSKQPSAKPSISANPSPKPVANQSSENPSSKPSKQPSANPSSLAPSSETSKKPSPATSCDEFSVSKIG